MGWAKRHLFSTAILCAKNQDNGYNT